MPNLADGLSDQRRFGQVARYFVALDDHPHLDRDRNADRDAVVNRE